MAIRKDEQVYSLNSLKELKVKHKATLSKLNRVKDINKRVEYLNQRWFLEKQIQLHEAYRKTLISDITHIHDKNKVVIRISDLISDNFKEYFKTTKPYRILKGGRSSLKSSAVSIKILTRFLSDPQANIVCFRKVGQYLSTSVYEQMKWAIYMLHAEDEFTFLKSPLRIVHNDTDTAIYFFGVDDPQKIKSFKIAKGYVTDLWFEEASEFEGEEEIDTVTDTFIRQELPDGKQVEITFTYNPPRNPYVWINEWARKKAKDDDYYVSHSTYLEDTKGFLSKQFLDKIAKVKATDKDYHDWMYLGKEIGLGDTVYNYKLFNVVNEHELFEKVFKEERHSDKMIFADVAIDSGYSTSATTFLYIGFTLKGKVIVLDTYYYSPKNKVQKKAPSEFSEDLDEFIKRNNEKWRLNIDTHTIDSAEGALRNQVNKDYGLYLQPAKKKQKQKMIENVEDLLVKKRVYVLDTENNEVFLDEHKKYQWDQKTIGTADPKVIKENDHTCDAFQYYVNNNLSKLNLKA